MTLATGPDKPSQTEKLESFPPCHARWLGRIGYEEAWQLQRELATKRALSVIPDTLLLLEHDPVYTTGRRGAGNHLRMPASLLGAPLIETDRGGDITFHGPGQLVAYPIICLREAHLGVAGYVRSLEEVIISTLSTYEIQSGREQGLTGVWTGGEKIAAIGVRVNRPVRDADAWITSHGLALNVDVDLGWFARVIPCGIADRGVTTMAKLLDKDPAMLIEYPLSLPEVAGRLARQFGRVLGREVTGPS